MEERIAPLACLTGRKQQLTQKKKKILWAKNRKERNNTKKCHGVT